MNDAELLSTLIGAIYDAALDPALWPDVLLKIARFVGGQAAGLLSKDSVSKLGNVHYHVGVDPFYIRLYQETHWKFDPMTPLLFFATEQVTTIADVVHDAEFREGRFYREWVKPQGFTDAANVVLDKSATSCAFLSVIRDEASGPVDDDMRARMQLIVPHVRRAVLIGKVIDLGQAEASTFADTLDGIAAGMLLVDAGGRIVHTNAAGDAMLAAADVLHDVSGHVAASDPQTQQALHSIFVAAGSGDAAMGDKGVSLPLTSRIGESHVAHVLPLTSGARRRAGARYAAVAVMFVHKAALEAPSPPEIIARHYKLTPTELRVMLAIVEIGGISQTAAALGIAETTVKTHLGHLYEKTGVSRQADLVKLVAGFANPLLG